MKSSTWLYVYSVLTENPFENFFFLHNFSSFFFIHFPHASSNEKNKKKERKKERKKKQSKEEESKLKLFNSFQVVTTTMARKMFMECSLRKAFRTLEE